MDLETLRQYWPFGLALLVGASLGAALGYFGQCTSGTCPLTSTWWRGALYGGVLGLLFALSSGAASSARAAADTFKAKSTAPAPVAPAWTLLNLDGKPVHLSDFQGKVVVLNFWATWCPPCRREIPDLVALQSKHAAQGVVVVGVSLDQDGPAAVKSFVAQNSINYPIVMGDQAMASAYGGISSIPTTLIIGRDGRIVGGIRGAADLAALEAAIKPAL